MKITHYGTLALLMIALVGCGKEKKEAQAAAKEIKAACDAKDKDKATELGKDAYAKNPAFKEAVDQAAVTWKVDDVDRFAYCGVGMAQVRGMLGD